MSDIVIRVENLSKRYRIGQREPYRALRDVLPQLIAAPFRLLRRNSQSEIQNPKSDYIWALKDVSFEVKRGEVVGIIGRNGAGKTTLLKILSRITEPTKGYAEVRGRVGSLLEVGTGFHPELTGRENIYLNGAILGMKKAEIDRKFDEIVAFAEVEKFIDTPVKYYSSGMYVRLAFSVAAHLETEVLLVDEVLAVGDAAFQQKCLLKIRDLTKQGVTSLFVSHNMHYVGILAKRCIYLRFGSIKYDGDTTTVIDLYLNDAFKESRKPEPQASDKKLFAHIESKGKWQILSVTATTSDRSTSELSIGEDLYITIHYKCIQPLYNVHFQASIWTEQGLLVTCADSRISNFPGWTIDGEGEITCVFPSIPLISGRYFVRVYMLRGDTDWPIASFGWNDGRICSFLIRPSLTKMVTGMVWYPTQLDYGVVKLPFQWHRKDTRTLCDQ